MLGPLSRKEGLILRTPVTWRNLTRGPAGVWNQLKFDDGFRLMNTYLAQKRDLPSGFPSTRLRLVEGNSLIFKVFDSAVGPCFFELAEALRGNSRIRNTNSPQVWAFREMHQPVVGDGCTHQLDFS